jgi:hypothetical protein
MILEDYSIANLASGDERNLRQVDSGRMKMTPIMRLRMPDPGAEAIFTPRRKWSSASPPNLRARWISETVFRRLAVDSKGRGSAALRSLYFRGWF